MDLALGGNTPTSTLELRAMQPMPGGSGYATLLVVRAGSFAAALPFFTTRDAVLHFTDALGALARSPAAEARLHAREGDDFVSINREADTATVRGVLSEDAGEQRLQFRFVTAASGLEALHEGLRRLIAG